VVAAIEDVLSGSDIRTPDLGGAATTSEVTKAVLAALGSRPTT
jgi:isocitrate/isopropylmalate dehydrogenase